MFSKKVLFYFAIGLLTFGVTVDALCDECSLNTYAACINETAFKICFDGKTKSDSIGICPEDQVCTDQPGICKPRSVGPQCGICNECMSGFACISQTQFEYCDGKKRIGIIGKCDAGQYCSVKNVAFNHNICVASCSSTPTCYAAEEVPTPAPPPDYGKICEGVTVWGNYQNTYDLTCQSYVYCEKLDGTMNAIVYNCGSGYFSAADKKCVPTKPSKCL